MPTSTISRCGGSSSQNWPTTVLGIAPAGTLRGYWRLGDLASPFLDSSGYSGGPTNMLYSSGSGVNPPSLHQPGLIPPSVDDGGIIFNNAGSGNFPHLSAAATGFLTGTAASLTVAGLVEITANAGTFRGGLLVANSIVAGSPSYENGWSLEIDYAASTYTAKFVRAISFGVSTSVSQVIAAGTKYLLVGTYDGATLSLYVNGALAASTADAHALGDVPGLPTIGLVTASQGALDGEADEVALWSVALTANQVAALWAAAN